MEAVNKESALVEFEKKLEDLIQRMRDLLKETRQEMDALSKTWKDHEFVRFKEQFAEDVERLKPLDDALEENQEKLKDIEAKVRQYLSHIHK